MHERGLLRGDHERQERNHGRECVQAVPDTRASYLVVDDSFGFDKMLTNHGCTAHFTRLRQLVEVVSADHNAPALLDGEELVNAVVDLANQVEQPS